MSVSNSGNAPQELFWGNGGAVGALAVTPDGRQIVSGGDDDGTIRLWDFDSGEELSSLTGHTSALWAVIVTPDGQQIVSGGADGTVRIWDRDSGQERAALTGHTGWALAVAVTADGRQIVSGGADGTVRIWDRDSGQERAALTGHTGCVWTVATTPDGADVLSGGEDGTLRVWDRASGQERAVLTGHSGLVWTMTVTPNGRQIASGGADGTVRIWGRDSRSQEAIFTGHTGAVWAVIATPDGRQIVSGGEDGALRAWDCHSVRDSGGRLTRRTRLVWAMAVTPDRRQIVSGGADGTVRIWDRDSGQERATLTGHTGAVRAVAVTPDGRQIVSAGEDGVVRVWIVVSKREQVTLTGHTRLVWAMAVTPDGRQIVSGGADGTVRVWDRDTGREQASYLGHGGLVWAVAVSPDGTEVVSASADRTIHTWSRHSRSQVRTATAGVTGPRGTLAGVRSDEPSDIDLLGIGDDVEALATLIAAATTEPPLSIALLGKWGAGKSTLIKHVRNRVDQLSAFSRENPDETAYATTIRQVTFNAWHYRDNHVWSGLIEHLFRELVGQNLSAVNNPNWVDDEYKRLREYEQKLESHRARLEQNLEASEARMVPTERPVGSSFISHMFETVWAAIQGMATEIWYLKRFWLAWLFLVIGAIIAWIVVAPNVQVTYKALVGVIVLAAPIITAANRIGPRIATIKEEKHVRLSQGLDNLDRSLVDTRARLVEIDAATRLAALLDRNANGSAYDPYRGLVGQVNRDLDNLHRALADARSQWRTSNSTSPPPLERVVLYIDDLDRCSPRCVVEVLNAIHLLLAKPLFVVVVAADADWLRRSLLTHHNALLASSDNAAPSEMATLAAPDPIDWLDKIFQIPYALPPMSDNAKEYIAALLPKDSENTVFSAIDSPYKEVFLKHADVGMPSLASSNLTNGSEAHAEGEVHLDDHAPPGSPRGKRVDDSNSVKNLQPAKLALTKQERTIIPLFGPFLATPRMGKKFINLYRLIRISVRDSELEDFIGSEEGGPYQAVLVLLVAVVDKPRLVQPLLSALTCSTGDGEITEFLSKKPCGQQLQPLCQGLSDVIISIRQQGYPVCGQLSAYKVWASRVARHSFQANG